MYRYDSYSSRKSAQDVGRYLKALNKSSPNDGAMSYEVRANADKSYPYALYVAGGAYKRGVTHRNRPVWADVANWLSRK